MTLRGLVAGTGPAPRGGRSLWRAGPLAVVLIAVAATVVTSRGEPDPVPGGPRPGSRGLPPVEVRSDAPQVGTLDELIRASDVVVTGTVAATERGRTFGDPGGTTIVSRLVTLRVDRVLAGAAPQADTVLVEEEGWLDDGRQLVVDGMAPTEPGDHGVWFLHQVADPDLPVYVVVSAQGRYLIDGVGHGHDLTGAAGDDPLVAQLEAQGLDRLSAAVAASGE